MDIATILAPVTGMLPAAWGDDVRLAVAATLLAAAVMAVVIPVAAAMGWRRTAKAGNGEAVVGVAATPATAPAALRARAPDLDPEEWMSGNVIHFDRHKAVGLIRCDRVKGPVRFDVAAFRRAPRVGEAVRFKGRHGARRKPVAVVVERQVGARFSTV